MKISKLIAQWVAIITVIFIGICMANCSCLDNIPQTTDVCEITQHYVWGGHKYHIDIITVHTDGCISLCDRLATMMALTTNIKGAYYTCRLVSETSQEVQEKLDKENQL